MSYEFIGTLCESRLIRNRNEVSKYTSKDAADLAFLYMCTLTLLNYEFAFAPSAVEYAKRTKSHGNYKSFRTGGNDLYMLLCMTIGELANEISDDASSLFKRKVSVNETDVRQFMNAIVSNKTDVNFYNQKLFKIEKQFGITNAQYKAIRRMLGDWPSLDHQQRSMVVTRLLQALRARARNSELLPVLTILAKDKNLEIKGANDLENQEPEGSKMTAGKAVAAIAAGAAIGWQIGKRIA